MVPIPKDAETTSFDLLMTANANGVSALLRIVRQDLEEAGAPASLQAMWELAMAEVLTNIVEHAYGVDLNQEAQYEISAGKPGEHPGRILVSLAFGPDMLDAHLTDWGKAMPDDAVPLPRPVDLDVPVEDLPEGGFGWSLIHALAERISYERRDGANHLILQIPLQD